MNDITLTTIEPANAREVVEAVRSFPQVSPIGSQTKPRLSVVNATKISTLALQGIVEYEPSEFTFTALAGTRVLDVAAALAEKGQYLPFDPMFVEAGATLGGTVASGLSGPGRFRFGGIRDFILGVQFVDGGGRLLRMGGKVVKNAAGFDLPKFFTGSLGRFGMLVEVTFKVFPKPADYLTLKLEASAPEVALQIMTAAAKSRWELDALDLLPDEPAVAMRLAGPGAGLSLLGKEILARWPGEIVPQDAADVLWRGLRECSWAGLNGVLVKLPVSPGSAVELLRVGSELNARMQLSAGGNVAFISVPANRVAALDQALAKQGLTGLMLRGVGPLWLGKRDRPRIAGAVKQALDSENRFPALDD